MVDLSPVYSSEERMSLQLLSSLAGTAQSLVNVSLTMNKPSHSAVVKQAGGDYLKIVVRGRKIRT